MTLSKKKKKKKLMGKQNLLVSKEPLVLWVFFFVFVLRLPLELTLLVCLCPCSLIPHLRNLLTHTLLKLSYEVGTLLSGNMPKVYLIQGLYSHSVYSTGSLLFTA